MREANTSVAEVGADLGMLGRIEAVLIEELGERRLGGLIGAMAGQHDVEKGLDHAAELGFGAAGGGEQVKFGAADWGECPPVLAEEGRGDEGVVGGGHECGGAVEQIGAGAMFIDGEVVDDRIHGEGEGVFEFLFGGGHDLLELVAGFGRAVGRHHEAHTAAGHPAEHPESPEVPVEVGTGAVDESLGIEI